MKLIKLTSRKPKKGMQYVLFAYNDHDENWECGGICRMTTKRMPKLWDGWSHWCEFKAPKGER